MLDQPISRTKKPLILLSSENFGLASEFEVSCFTCQEMISKLESARSNNIEEENGEVTNKEIEAKQFSINKQFILGCHA